MFTQFFGNYLFNEKLVTKQQLIEALEMQKFARAKLGVLAINAGYMTGAQVDEVHAEQQRMDKRFGDIAVEKGYMTESQVETLLSNQKQAHLVIGQALVDKGYLTNEQFANALAKYKENNLIEERDFTDDQNRKIDTIIRNFYIFNTFDSDVEFFTEYTSLVFKNIIRFIGDDFIPLAPEATTSYKAEKISYQMVNGKGNVFTAIEGPEAAMIEFAKRYSHEELDSFDELARESVAEFYGYSECAAAEPILRWSGQRSQRCQSIYHHGQRYPESGGQRFCSGHFSGPGQPASGSGGSAQYGDIGHQYALGWTGQFGLCLCLPAAAFHYDP